ncbi:MAG: hypothetical protein PHT60_03725 [Acidiphilium sp.]|nr:hypothetical protein [Acidiphilium sp.]MDD4934867.1 hypothetical protein [Acidiphilium sp.]
MSKAKYWLLAAGAVALPVAAWAAGPSPVGAVYQPIAAARATVLRPGDARRRIVMIPIAFTTLAMPMPMMIAVPAMPVQAPLMRQIVSMQAQLQATMAAMQQFVMPPLLVPGFPAGRAGVTQVTMVTVDGAGRGCSEQMRIIHGPNGQTGVLIHRSGDACGPLPAAMPGVAGREKTMPGAGSLPSQAGSPLPSGALPPPSKLIYAAYKLPPRVAQPAQQG